MDFIKVKDSDKVPRQFKTARLINKLKVIEAAEKLGVSQPTLSAWEGERKSPSIDSLENMADLYSCLAAVNPRCQIPVSPISLQSLPSYVAVRYGLPHMMAVGECCRQASDLS